jgi:hypothetical protein
VQNSPCAIGGSRVRSVAQKAGREIVRAKIRRGRQVEARFVTAEIVRAESRCVGSAWARVRSAARRIALKAGSRGEVIGRKEPDAGMVVRHARGGQLF